MDNPIRGLYAIIDTTYINPPDASTVTTQLLRGGARIIQLRAKGIGGRIMLKAAQEIREITSKEGAIFIVNDRADIALLSGADGVHLGQDDITAKDCALLKKGMLIGVSTHNGAEARQAELNGATYISFGPIYPTRTKKDADTPKGLDRLKEIRACVTVPIVAIGGITEALAGDVTEAGADSVAMISELLTAPDITAKTSSAAKAINAYYNR